MQPAPLDGRMCATGQRQPPLPARPPEGLSMKRMAGILLATLALVSATSAFAYTTPPSSGRHDLLTCKQGGVIGQPASDRFGAISSTDFVYLSVGWATYTEALANNFLGNQFGTITVHQGSPT